MLEGVACSDCLRGTVQTGTPKGTVSTVHGLPTYTARPEGEPKGVIVLIPDIFGWELANPRLLADTYAREGGFLVYLPEFMDGMDCPSSLETLLIDTQVKLRPLQQCMPWMVYSNLQLSGKLSYTNPTT
jgi:dienelactone hydrolase